MTKESIRLPSEVPIALPEYHSWQEEFQPIFTRDRLLRPMTKDPYHQNQRRLANAVETKATEEECCPVLISPAEVQVHKPTIHHSSSGRSRKSIDEYVSNQSVISIVLATQTVRFADDARRVSLAKPIGQQSKSPAPAIHQSSKTYGTAPVLATEARLLNRAKMRDDVLVIRRPPRRLTIHITHETMLPLAVCG